ncbi:MAG TPA: GMC family oxidoreductase [Vicinamibacteria bacterium]|nr:GMC family oxidoreductase [Vicinamibacteria bacterium]
MPHDAIVIGSGFGGTLAAHALVEAGARVLMIERGDWVRRGPDNWAGHAVAPLSPHYRTDTPYQVLAGAERGVVGSIQCVGGPSVFYGGVSLRLRARDFAPDSESAGAAAGAAWPFAYEELEPFYDRAERLIGVAGQAGDDPTEPPRSRPYPHSPGALAPASRLVWQAARDLGLHPFRLPLAFNHTRAEGRSPCVGCPTCDGFACAVEAKNDLATAVLPGLLKRGLELRTGTVAGRLVSERGRVRAAICIDRATGRLERHSAPLFVLAAGALASPHLVLASGLESLNPAGHLVGRFLMRHWNAVVMGFFPGRPGPERQFHKQVGIHDFYFGHGSVRRPHGRLGGIQQLATPPAALVRSHLPAPVGALAATTLGHVTGLLVIAEDEPQESNGLAIDPRGRDRFGLPQLLVTHRYTTRDVAAGNVLVGKAKAILHRAGACLTYVQPIRTFSHALGTLRMGTHPRLSVVDPHGRFRGLENLYVADASVFPTSASVNPSLTIAAGALRIGEALAHQGVGAVPSWERIAAPAEPAA